MVVILPWATSLPFRCMVTVDIRLNRYQYRFRKLTYREEFALDRKAGVDGRKTILAAAMVEVSGLPILSPADALLILTTVPAPVLNRVWALPRRRSGGSVLFNHRPLSRPGPSSFPPDPGSER